MGEELKRSGVAEKKVIGVTKKVKKCWFFIAEVAWKKIRGNNTEE